MWIKFIGGVLVLTGAVFLASPERLRRKLQRGAKQTIRRYLFAAACFLSVLLFSAGWKQEGMFPKLLFASGIVILLKGLYFLKAKSAELVITRLVNLPGIYFRIFAILEMLVGLLIISRLGK